MKKKMNTKKVEVTLWEHDLQSLQSYCDATGLTRAVAIRHLVREGLKEVATGKAPQEARNQLGLFDSVQIDIFNQTSKTN